MYCPVCGQQQISDQTRFCSRCGSSLAGLTEVVANGGITPGAVPQRSGTNSPRRRGLKQGLFIFLLSFLVVPLISIITIAVNAEPFAVALSAILLTVGGLLRAVYALMFEPNDTNEATLEERLAFRSEIQVRNAAALPPHRSMPASDYVSPAAGSWRDTNDLQRQPDSVTERTTRLLEKEMDG